MMRLSQAAIALAGMVATAAAAAATERVGGWVVSPAPDASGTCTAVRAYRDPEDGNAANRITLALSRPPGEAASLTLTLFYEGWQWDPGEAVSAELLAGSRSLVKDARWTTPTATELSGRFSGIDLVLWGLSTASTLTLRFEGDAEAEFEVPDSALAVEALRLCGGT